MRIVPWIIVVAGVLTPLGVRAQTAGYQGTVREGDRVRVRTTDGQLLLGRFTTSPLSAPSLRVDDVAEPVALGDVDSLWVRGKQSGTGAIVGSIVGAVGGLALGYHACNLDSDGHGCQEAGDKKLVVLGGLLGATVGLGLGALIGSAFPTWRLRYPSSS